MKAYLESLSDKEKKAYDIAKHHLGMSFDLEKSRGFKQYSEKIKTTQEATTPVKS